MSDKKINIEVVPDDYIKMNCGITIPVIEVCDKDDEDLTYLVAPSEALKLLQNGMGEIEGEEATQIDNQIFYFADHFAKDKLMIAEIEASTDIENLKIAH